MKFRNVAAVPLVLLALASCKAPISAKHPGTPATALPESVAVGTVTEHYEDGQQDWLTIKTKNITALTFAVSAETYRKCQLRSAYPKCKK